jgi:hypothetical protein
MTIIIVHLDISVAATISCNDMPCSLRTGGGGGGEETIGQEERRQ